jgi:signal peptidase II
VLAGREPLTPTEPTGAADWQPNLAEPTLGAGEEPAPANPGAAPVSVKPGPARPPTGPARSLRSTRRRYTILLTTAIVVIALDHLTKWLVSTHVVLDTQVPAGSPVTIHYIQNSGAAFGLFPQFDFLYLVVAAVVAGYILVYGPSMGGGMLRLLALGCILGGSISNGVDRLAQGYVVDFIDFHFWLFQIFNVADMGIVGGMLVIVYQLGIRHDSVASG